MGGVHLLPLRTFLISKFVVLTGSTSLLSLMCNRLPVVDLLRHNRHAISSTRPI